MTATHARTRALSVGVSALFWGSACWLALTQAPKLMAPPRPDPGPVIEAVKPPEPLIETIVEPLAEPSKRPQPIVRNPAPTPPVLTERPPQAPPMPVPGARASLPQGAAPAAPAVSLPDPGFSSGIGNDVLAPPAPLPEPVIEAVPPAVESAPPPPLPALVVNPVRVRGPDPVFPARALERGIEGSVTLSFTVGVDGRISGLTIERESPAGFGFGRAALSAFRGWVFQPMTVDGAPTAYPARYTVEFRLED